MTFQTKDDFQLLPTSPTTSDNGESGSPKWVGDFRATWETDGGFTLFSGMNVIGSTSDVGDFLDRNGGDPCLASFRPSDPSVTLRDRHSPRLTPPAHSSHIDKAT